MSAERTPAERFRMFALNCGTNENDPFLTQAEQTLRKFGSGEATPEEVDAAIAPLFESWYKAAREARTQAVAMAAESNSMKAVPLREWARQSNIAENDPLLVRAAKAQERADWRTSWESWMEMEIAVMAFMRTHFEFKNAWPPQTGEIEYFLQKLKHDNLTPTEVEKFRHLAAETFHDWQPEYSPAFKRRIEAGLSRLDSHSK
jgi:hypothetical protein